MKKILLILVPAFLILASFAFINHSDRKSFDGNSIDYVSCPGDESFSGTITSISSGCISFNTCNGGGRHYGYLQDFSGNPIVCSGSLTVGMTGTFYVGHVTSNCGSRWTLSDYVAGSCN